MKKKINIGVVGLGNIGRRHLRLVREFLPGIKITIVRSTEGKAVSDEKIADNIVYSLQDAIESGVQAAVIATPALFHLSQTSELMRAGVHILVEKPLSDTMNGINELIESIKLIEESHLGINMGSSIDEFYQTIIEYYDNDEKLSSWSKSCLDFIKNKGLWKHRYDNKQNIFVLIYIFIGRCFVKLMNVIKN